MNKKIIFTCVLLVLLAFTATACKLPASGSPPTTTSAPIVPTATTKAVAVAPTNTSVPPTPLVPTETIPPTPLLPTPVPATPVPPTPVPPTPTPLPQAIRIQFAAGGTSAVIDGEVEVNQTVYYVLKASATQTMSVKIASPNGDVYLGVSGADGQVLLASSTQNTTWSGTLPTTQDYYLSLTAGNGATSYTLTVDIPPLAIGPTANVTPVAGTFDPVATYGNPTFDDPMTGGNVNDWVNPVTGLLPNTNYLKIVESDAKFYVTGKLTGFSTWYFTWHELTDFYLQSTFDSGSCSGKDAYGLIVRGPEHLAGVSYGYVVALSCDGQYYIFRLDGANPYTTKDLVIWTKSDYILVGANQKNVLGIKAVGNTLTIYINGHQIADVFENKYTFGRYGVFVSPDVTENYTYQVVQMSYWGLKH
jgi:hypothetical protein